MSLEKASSFTVSAKPSQVNQWRKAAKKAKKRFSPWVADTLNAALNAQPAASNE